MMDSQNDNVFLKYYKLNGDKSYFNYICKIILGQDSFCQPIDVMSCVFNCHRKIYYLVNIKNRLII